MIRIYLKKCIQRHLKKYIVFIDMNKEDIKTLKEKTLKEKTLKEKVSSMDMTNKNLKKLTKAQKPSDSVNKPIPPLRTGKWKSVEPKSVPRKSVNEYEDLILPPPE